MLKLLFLKFLSFFSSLYKKITAPITPLKLNKNKTVRNILCSNYSSYNFCTIIGKDYVIKVLSLYKSLEKTCKSFKLYICCIDNIAYSILLKLNLENAIIFTVDKIEDTELLSVKQSRKTNEYCWTLKAPLIEYVLKSHKLDNVIYCDSDIYFFSEPKAIYDEWEDYDVFICPQRDLQWVEDKYGKYQAGMLGFKNTYNSMQCLNFWKSKCIEWCFSACEPEMNRFGDQKYLDQLPLLFKGVKVLENLGVDAAPWNCIYNNNYNIYEKNNQIHIEKNKLIAFHFATIKIYNTSEFDLWSFNYIPIKKIIKDKIYFPYLTTIRASILQIEAVDKDIIYSLLCQDSISTAQTYYKYPPKKFRIDIYDNSMCFCTIISTEYLIKGLTFYNSLKTHCNKFHLWIYCIDNATYSFLNSLNLKNTTLIPYEELENDALKRCKKERNLNEYCWTLKAPLIEYILINYDTEYIIYCDADLFFFSDPSLILNNWKGYYIYICTQRADSKLEEINGRFQAGFIGFKKIKESFKILKWWNEKCIDWCFDRPEPEFKRWGDQKYLDEIPFKFCGIKIEENLGINAAPWNTIFNNNFNIHEVSGNVYIENSPLIFYHFGSMLFYNKYEYELWKLEPLNFSTAVIDKIYIPYLKAVKNTINKISPNKYIKLFSILSDKKTSPPINYFNLMDYMKNKM